MTRNQAKSTIRISRMPVAVFTLASVAALSLLLFVGCSPSTGSSTAEEDATSEEAAGTPFTWSEDADCIQCHTDQGASMGNTAMCASQHADVSCMSCHTDSTGLSEAHSEVSVGDKTPSRLSDTEIDDQVCLECHEGTVEALAEATQDMTPVVDSEGTEVQPHATLLEEQHESLTCASCHTMHEEEDLSKTAKNQCITCHHSDTFECYTCHE